jgi:outer membrane protein TolC
MVMGMVLQSGCQSPTDHRKEADKVASDVIREQQLNALGKIEDFTISRPSDILRRRLLEGQGLPYSGPASLGTDKLEPIEHWPEDGYPGAIEQLDPIVVLEPDMPVQLTLMQALQVGARNSFEYQTRKEDVFRKALDLDLKANDFRTIFTRNKIESDFQRDTTGDDMTSSTSTEGDFRLQRQLESGATITFNITMAIANLLTAGTSSFGSQADTSISIPLLRGSGRHIVTEPLTQAQRDVVYAIYDFERFKKTYAVDVASSYLGVLGRLDGVKNNEDNYRRSIASARRERRRADAGRQTEVEVDQAVQNELRARNSWIRAMEGYKGGLDSFKNLLGLPPDANIELDRSELEGLNDRVKIFLSKLQDEDRATEQDSASDAEIILVGADMENTGPLEIDELRAIELAFENRLDFRKSQGRVYDAQRKVVVLADALRAELTIGGSVVLGGEGEEKIRTDKGIYSSVFTFDPALERTAERNAYRKGYIALEQATREVQIFEDRIKLNVRNKLRDLLESRESVQIQTKSVKLAEKRVRSVNLFLEAGRRQIRDLLEAQDALLEAQNDFTTAIVSYRVAELELQRDMGVLTVDEKGIWQEYSPEETGNENE